MRTSKAVIDDNPEEVRVCSKCSESKLNKDFRIYKEKRVQPCRECLCKMEKEYRSKPENRERYRQHNKRYCATEEYKAKKKEIDSSPERVAYRRKRNQTLEFKRYKKEWEEKNKEARSIYLKDYYSKYAKTEREKTRWIANAKKKREKRMSIGDRFTPVQIREVHQRFGLKCFKCGSQEKLCIDHHFPLARGFGLSEFNAVTLCRKCNRAKSDKMPSEFYTSVELEELDEYLSGPYLAVGTLFGSLGTKRGDSGTQPEKKPKWYQWFKRNNSVS